MGSPMIQGSQEWLDMRKKHIGASDGPIIMGVSPWRTPFQLWQEKLGLAAPQEWNSSMQRGNDLEPKARAAFEAETGFDVFPQVVFHPEHKWMMASLDGLSLCGKVAVEIKCTSKKCHEMALAGEVPPHYIPQLQHQLCVLDLEMLYYFSFDGYNGAIVKVNRDESYIKKLIKEETKFWKCLKDKTPPDLSDRDFVERTDPTWLEYAERLRELDTQIKSLKESRDNLKEGLIGLADGQSSKGGGLKLSRSFVQGRVDYGKIPHIEGIDLEPFRKPATETWRLSCQK